MADGIWVAGPTETAECLGWYFLLLVPLDYSINLSRLGFTVPFYALSICVEVAKLG